MSALTERKLGMIHRMRLVCWPFWSWGSVGAVLGLGESGSDDFGSMIVQHPGEELTDSPRRMAIAIRFKLESKGQPTFLFFCVGYPTLTAQPARNVDWIA